MSSDETVSIITPSPAYGSLTCAVGVEELQGILTFHDIGYEVSVRCGRGRKVILESCRYILCAQHMTLVTADSVCLSCECSGIMRPGLNAIIGPTGSGKTT